MKPEGADERAHGSAGKGSALAMPIRPVRGADESVLGCAGPDTAAMPGRALPAVVEPEASLSVRPVRQPDESARGFVLRQAARNGLASPRWLPDAAKVLGHGMARLCPECLVDSPVIWKTDWECEARPWCLKHHCWLIDQCTRCMQHLTWSRVRHKTCLCGALLKGMGARPVSPRVYATLVEERVPLDVLMWLGAMDKYGPGGKPRKKASRRSMNDVVELVDRGVVLAAGWPASFQEALERHRVRPSDPRSVQLLNEAFPGLNEALLGIRDVVWHRKVVAAVSAHVEESARTSWPLIGRNAAIAGLLPTFAEIAGATGVRTGTLQRLLLDSDPAGPASRVTSNGRLRRVVAEVSISKAKELHADQICLKPAARILGLTSGRLRQLVAEKLLVERRKRLSKAAVHEFARTLAEAAVGIERIRPGTVTLREALRKWVGTAMTANFIRSLLRGDIALFGSNDQDILGQMRVQAAEVLAWREGTIRVEKVVSIPGAARTLGLKQEVVYHLVDCGHLKVVIDKVGGRSTRAVTASALREFSESFVPLVVLAQAEGIAPKAAYAWAMERGLEVVSGPAVDGSRQYFVRRATQQRA